MSPFLVRPPDDGCGRHAIRRQGPAIGLRHAARRPFASSPLEVGQRAPLPRSAAGRPLTPPVGAGKRRAHRSKGEPCSEAEPNPGGALTRFGTTGVGGSRWWPDHHRWLPGDLDHRGWPSGRALNSSTLTLITLARRPITATGRASSPHRSRFCDSHSAPQLHYEVRTSPSCRERCRAIGGSCRPAGGWHPMMQVCGMLCTGLAEPMGGPAKAQVAAVRCGGAGGSRQPLRADVS